MTHMTGPFLRLTGPFLHATLLFASAPTHQQHQTLFEAPDPIHIYNLWLDTISLPAALTLAESFSDPGI